MELETLHVRNVYTEIAHHFSDTRHCIWDFVRDFISRCSPDMKGIDIGCGNGKNMTINKSLDIIGLDSCAIFVDICKQKNLHAFKGDCCNIARVTNSFDFAMAIAVFHHMGDDTRREQCIQEMVRILKPGGKGLFSVWSIENQDTKRNFTAGDNYVKWTRHCDKKIFQRYYYVFNRTMLTRLLSKFSHVIAISTVFNERGNWVVEFTKL